MWKADNPLQCLPKIAFFSAFSVWIFKEKNLHNFVKKEIHNPNVFKNR